MRLERITIPFVTITRGTNNHLNIDDNMHDAQSLNRIKDGLLIHMLRGNVPRGQSIQAFSLACSSKSRLIRKINQGIAH